MGNPTITSVTLEEFLAALNVGIINNFTFGTGNPEIRWRPYMDMRLNLNRYSTHEDIEIRRAMLHAISRDNIDPWTPP